MLPVHPLQLQQLSTGYTPCFAIGRLDTTDQDKLLNFEQQNSGHFMLLAAEAHDTAAAAQGAEGVGPRVQTKLTNATRSFPVHTATEFSSRSSLSPRTHAFRLSWICPTYPPRLRQDSVSILL